jgi:hypothetical protein
MRRIVKAGAFTLLGATCAAPATLLTYVELTEKGGFGCEEVLLGIACLIGLHWSFEAFRVSYRLWRPEGAQSVTTSTSN